MATIRVLIAAIAATVAVVGAASAFAGYDYFLKIEGVDGESRAAGHEKWIEVQSVQWASGGAAVPTSQGPGMLTVQLKPGRHAAALKRKQAAGKPIKSVTLAVPQDGSYLEVKLENALITSYQTSTPSASSLPMESLSFNYTKITY